MSQQPWAVKKAAVPSDAIPFWRIPALLIVSFFAQLAVFTVEDRLFIFPDPVVGARDFWTPAVVVVLIIGLLSVFTKVRYRDAIALCSGEVFYVVILRVGFRFGVELNLPLRLEALMFNGLLFGFVPALSAACAAVAIVNKIRR